MSIWFITLAAVFFFFLFSQFGAALAARNAIGWWLIAAFLAIGAVQPDLYQIVSTSLGFHLVSNFVFAAMFVFFILQIIQMSRHITAQARRTRSLVSRLAADEYLQRTRDTSYHRHPSTPLEKVLIVVPCYNEEESLHSLIPRIQKLNMPFCIVDDGSRDGSREVLQRLCPRNAVFHSTNVNVAGVLLTGFDIARRTGAEWVVQCDGDGQHPIEMIPDLCDKALRTNVDILVGSRFSEGRASIKSTSLARRAGGIWISTIIRALGGSKVTDPTSGFRVYSLLAIKTLTATMPDEYPEPESLMLAAIQGLAVAEHPVDMLPRSTGTSSIAGLQSIQYMLKVTTAILGMRLRHPRRTAQAKKRSIQHMPTS